MQTETSMTPEEVVDVAVFAGEILLKSGAETYRVEDTISRMCRAKGVTEIQPFVTPTAIIIGSPSVHGYSRLLRIFKRDTDLASISETNNFSYSFKKYNGTKKEAFDYLRGVFGKRIYPVWLRPICAGLGAGLFTVLLGGGIYEFIAALLSAFVAMTILIIKIKEASIFISNAISGAIIATVVMLLSMLIPQIQTGKVIATAIFPFLPGMPFTNSIRDYLAGDLISGSSRMSESLIAAASLAAGIAAVLKLWMLRGSVF